MFDQIYSLIDQFRYLRRPGSYAIFGFDESDLIIFLSFFMILSGLITAAYMLVFKQRATYGRYGKDAILNWLAVPARLAWFIQEAPSLLIPLGVLLFDPVVKTNYVNLSIILMFAGHYFHRWKKFR